MSSKLFVLDTNVLLHDPSCLFRFEDNDLFIPMATLEELDAHKKGTTDLARSARQASRTIDRILETFSGDLTKGLPLSPAVSGGKPLGKLFLSADMEGMETTSNLSPTPDNRILACVRKLRVKHEKREVVLVSKDINMRIKAHAMGLLAQDYRNDMVLEDSDVLPTGYHELSDDFWSHAKDVKSSKDNHITRYILDDCDIPLRTDEYVIVNNESTPFVGRVVEADGKKTIIETIRDFRQEKNSIWGIRARNAQQMFAMDALINPDIDFVSLVGQAGSGKTLLAIAAGLHLVMEEKLYSEIIFTRVTVPMGEDIGFLPGSEEEKMAPWMGALDDNLEVLHSNGSESKDWSRAATMDIIRSKIKIKSMNFMRGRTFINKFMIIDEAQNLTSKQMKALITRAGPGTKVICLGNLSQIDTPYLTEGTSGLAYVVDRFRGVPHTAHVLFSRVERSRLAEIASERL